MALTPNDEISPWRAAVSSWPAEASSDAHGVQAPSQEEMYAPASQAAALDPRAPIVRGARGTGKGFWAGVLYDAQLRKKAAAACPRLGLDQIDVKFGYTGLAGPDGIDKEKLDACVGPEATDEDACRFWWATVLRATILSEERSPPALKESVRVASRVEQREAILDAYGNSRNQTKLLVVYDQLTRSRSIGPAGVTTGPGRSHFHRNYRYPGPAIYVHDRSGSRRLRGCLVGRTEAERVLAPTRLPST